MFALLMALLCASAAAEGFYGGDGDPYFHRAAECALAGEAKAISGEEADALCPCPVCVPEAAKAGDPQAWERGGTVVVRVPDQWIRMMVFEGEPEETAVPDAILHAGETQDMDLARLVHGEDYLACLNLPVGGTALRVDAFALQVVGEDALVMSQRHLGGAWYLAVRPGKDQYKKGRLTLPVDLYYLDLEARRYPAGFALSAGEGSGRCSEKIKVKPKKSVNAVVFDHDFEGLQVTALRDDGVNVCVFRDRAPHEFDLNLRWLRYLGDVTPLAGYQDDGAGVYCCAVTDAELAGLQSLLAPDIDYVPAGQAQGDSAAATLAEPAYAPAIWAELPDGALASMDQAEYPVGTPFVSYTFTLPEGGIGSYGAEVVLQRYRDGRWRDVKPEAMTARTGRGEEGTSDGCYCGSKTLVLPLDDVGALEEGLYRIRVHSVSVAGSGTVRSYLEFRISADAPLPAEPDLKGETGHMPVPAHAVPHRDAPNYNSCTDNTFLRRDGLLLAGDVVFDLRGVDESWGWGIESRYGLFAYPQGHRERAVMLVEDIDVEDASLYDTGDGLLLWAGDGFRRMDYDGGNMTKLPDLFHEEDEDHSVQDFLLVGDGMYVATGDAIWRAELADMKPVKVYAAQKQIDNDFAGGGFMVYDSGTLFVADGGVVALDTLHPNGDGTLPAKRLNKSYDPDDGEAGYGYIALNGRLYGWSGKEQQTMSMAYDGSDLRPVSKTRFHFVQVTAAGDVLALSGKTGDTMFDGWERCALYHAPDPEHPAFDPDHCQKRELSEGDYDYILGDVVVHNGEAWGE